MADGDNDVRVEIYRHFAEIGSAPTHVDIAHELDLEPAEVEGSYRRLADDHVIVLAPGSPYIWMANPFSAVPTPFAVQSGDQRWWGNCIWDALGILALVGRDGEVRTSCPDCGEALTVSVADGRVPHDHRVVHYSIPAARWWDDIGLT